MTKGDEKEARCLSDQMSPSNVENSIARTYQEWGRPREAKIKTMALSDEVRER